MSWCWLDQTCSTSTQTYSCCNSGQGHEGTPKHRERWYKCIITKVNKPTSYVNSMVVVNKPRSDKVRIVIDPKNLNKAIKRPHYSTKTLDDILPQFKSAKYFKKIDCKSGYRSVVLDEKVFLSNYLQHSPRSLHVFKMSNGSHMQS